MLDGLVECTCCNKGVLEVKCPYRCGQTNVVLVSKQRKCLVNSSNIDEGSQTY